MSITKKRSPLIYILKITFCLAILLIAEFYIGGSFASEVQKTNIETITITPIPSTPTPFARVQEAQTDAQSPFFWHFAWLGTVLSLCGLIGLSAVIRKFKPAMTNMFEFHPIKKEPNHIPAPW